MNWTTCAFCTSLVIWICHIMLLPCMTFNNILNLYGHIYFQDFQNMGGICYHEFHYLLAFITLIKKLNSLEFHKWKKTQWRYCEHLQKRAMCQLWHHHRTLWYAIYIFPFKDSSKWVWCILKTMWGKNETMNLKSIQLEWAKYRLNDPMHYTIYW